MRVAFVLVPSFPIAVERLVGPRLAGQPVVVLDRGFVIDASADCALGRGLPQRQAKALCPGARFIEANHALYRRVDAAMLDALESVTPLVEPAGPGAAYCDVRGLEGHYSDEFALAKALADAVRDATRLVPSVGIGSGKFVAQVAAFSVPPGDAGIVPTGREQEFLRDKDVGLLPFGPDVVERLQRLALRTLGRIADLPQPAVEAQFRSIGRRLWGLANGIDPDPLRPRKRDEVLGDRLSFDAPVIATDALVLAGRELLTRLLRRLRGRTARHMHIELLADERIVWERSETFREPTGDERRMLLVLKTRLSLLELPQAVDTVVVTLIGIGREMAKHVRLFRDAKPNAEELARSLQQLRARYGRDVVHHIVNRDPRSRHPEERAALSSGRLLNVPRRIHVRTGAGGAPEALQSNERWLPVAQIIAHHKVDDRWWKEKPVRRDYYELVLEDEQVATVFHDLTNDRWYRQRYG